MVNAMDELRTDRPGARVRALNARMDAFGWGLFFIWAGIAVLADVGWSAGILGVGVIALGLQAARRYLELPLDLFGLGMGLAIVAWAAWDYFQPRTRLDVSSAVWPVLFIALGAVLVVRALRRGRHREARSDTVHAENA